MSTTMGDRNLLFGILALQMDFIVRDQLIAAMNAWVLEKSKRLGQVLLAQKALSPDTHALLEALVQKHLALHGNDVDKSLAAVSSSRSFRNDLEQIDDADLQASLRHVTSDPYAVTASCVGTTTSAGTRFRILRPHKKGGLGQVYVAHDEELHREVALKEIQGRYADNMESRARFILEAEITGGLEHPCIVPVYGLGQYADGRPFYAMRFIRGDCLQDAINRFHQAVMPRLAASERTLELRQLLGRFIDVCQAIQYAHDRGILHRDLKPGNIMLGKYGETLVVDWGLAKALARAGAPERELRANVATLRPADEPTLHPKAAGDVTPTLAGSALGTPAFMSPEQAAGHLDELGAATDVYSLGATLFCLLTGKAPVEDKDAGVVLQKVQKGDYPRPRQLNPNVDPALEPVCLKAMDLQPAERYAAPRDLANDIEHWLADEPVSAHAEHFLQRARRWTRRHRILVTSAAAVLLVATIGALVSAALLANLNGQLEARNRALDAANGQLDAANLSLKATNDRLDVANANLQATNARLDLEKQIAQAVGAFLQNDLLRQASPTEQANRLLTLGDDRFKTMENPTIKDLLDRAASELTLNRIEQKFPKQPLVQAEILQTLGFSYFGVGDFDKAAAHLERARPLFQSELGSDHPTTLLCTNNLAQAYRANGKLQLALPLYEETLKLTRSKLGPDDLQTGVSMNSLAMGYFETGRLNQAVPLFEATLQLRKAKLAPDDADTLTSMNNLALAYFASGRLDRAIPLFDDVVKLMKKKLGSEHPDTLTSMNNRALGYKAAGKLDVALPLFEETLKLRKAKLGSDHPDTLVSMNNLAEAYYLVGKMKLALPLFEDTVKLMKAKLGPDHPYTLHGMNNLGVTYRTSGKLDLAMPLLEETLKLRKAKLGGDHPDTLASLNNLAGGFRDVGKPNLALPLFEEAVALMKTKVGPDHPNTLKIMNNLVEAYIATGQSAKALPLIAEYVAGQRKSLGANDQRFADVLAEASLNLLKARRYPEAETLLRECLSIREKSAPDAWTTFNTKAMLGAALLGQKKYADAEPLLLAGYQALKEREATIPDAGKDRLIEAEGRLAELWEATRTKDEAKLQGKLTDAKKEAVHEVKLTAGTPAVIEMQSRDFDTLLRLHNAKGMMIAENDDIDFASKNLNSRILFIPIEDGVYRVTATSFQQSGRGMYEIILRQYGGGKSK